MYRSNTTNDQLSLIFSALSSPIRRQILSKLKTETASVSEICKPLKISQPAVTKHLKVLERAGLIERTHQAQMIYSRLHAQPLRDVSEWLEGYREFWTNKFDRLERYVQEIEENENE